MTAKAALAKHRGGKNGNRSDYSTKTSAYTKCIICLTENNKLSNTAWVIDKFLKKILRRVGAAGIPIYPGG